MTFYDVHITFYVKWEEAKEIVMKCRKMSQSAAKRQKSCKVTQPRGYGDENNDRGLLGWKFRAIDRGLNFSIATFSAHQESPAKIVTPGLWFSIEIELFKWDRPFQGRIDENDFRSGLKFFNLSSLWEVVVNCRLCRPLPAVFFVDFTERFGSEENRWKKKHIKTTFPGMSRAFGGGFCLSVFSPS